jgi:hypothetical protein
MEPTEKCGEFAASFIPRWGMYFTCVLPKGHDGGPESHRAGGKCKKHGEYVMEHFGEAPRCPQWPDCTK